MGPLGTLPLGVINPYDLPVIISESAMFLSSKRFDGATLLASSAEATLPVEFLQNPDPAAKWRATGCTDEYILIDAQSAYAMDTLMLVGHNLSGDATIRVRSAMTVADVTDEPISDTGWVSAWPESGKPEDEDWPSFLSLARWALGVCRYVRLDMADASNPDGYVEAARIFVGNAFQPTYNVDADFSIGLDTPDQQTRSDFGKTFIDPRGDAGRRLTLPVSAVNWRELMDELYALQRYLGIGRDFGFVLDPGDPVDFHKYAIQCAFMAGAQFDAQPVYDPDGQIFRTSFTLTEML